MSEPDAYLILYGDRRQFRCLVLERAAADLRAASLHGVKVPLVVPDEFRHLLGPDGVAAGVTSGQGGDSP